ncbi:MAG: ribonuclease P protein component [Chloroflexota bacterium]
MTRSTEFQRVRRYGKSYAHPLMVLVALPAENPAPQPHCGVTAGRSVGSAVQRNRAKRLLRAAVQPHLPAILPGWDLVLIAREPLLRAGFVQIQAALSGLLRRARLLREAHDLREH